MNDRKKFPSAQDLIHSQLKQKTATRLVNSPHAKYNSRNQLMCVVCGCRVTSAIVWQAHVAKKSHLENLANLKQKQSLLNNHVKRKSTHASADAPPMKKASNVPTVSPFKPKGILKGIKSYDSSSEDDNDTDLGSELPADKDSISDPNNQLPKIEVGEDENMEFIQGKIEVKEEDENDPTIFYLTDKDKTKPAAAAKPNTTEKLPEGFFDDPIADAKARKVEYVNKDEAEWNAFMQEVSAAETTSRQIIADDTEESAKRNQILQAEEQMLLYKRVLLFDQAKQDHLQATGDSCCSQEPVDEVDIDDSDEDGTLMSPINWRNKSSSI